MKPWVGPIRNEKGVALPLALFALMMLSGLLLAFLSMAGMEPSIAANLSDATRARYLADGGIEWAFDRLVTAPMTGPGSWDDILKNGGTMATDQTFPGLPVTAGIFTVTIRNDNQAGDNQITGLPACPTSAPLCSPDGGVAGGNPTTDSNGVLIVTATGTYNGVQRQIQVVMTAPPAFPGGLFLPGIGSNTSFSGNAFEISGHDTNLDDSRGACSSVYGIGVANTATEGTVQTSLTAQQKDNITGRKQDDAGLEWGDNTIAPDDSFTPAQIRKLVEAAKQKAQVSSHSTKTKPLHYTSVGDTCAADWDHPNCWGTRDRPKIIYVKGAVDPTASFNALTISGTSTGTGVLIVEDGDLRIDGDFRWEGLIIVTGKYVGLRYGGGGGQTTYGGIVINEEKSFTPNLEVDSRGNAKIRYSCAALNTARSMRGLYSLRSWREL